MNMRLLISALGTVFLFLPPVNAHATDVEARGSYQRADGSVRNFKVLDGDVLRPGDRFQIILSADTPIYYSVVYVSRNGEIAQISPPGEQPGKIAAGVKQYVPGSDNYFALDSNGGRELMYVITDEQNLKNLPAMLSQAQQIGNIPEEIHRFLQDQFKQVDKMEIVNTGTETEVLKDNVTSGLVQDITQSYLINPWSELQIREVEQEVRRRSADNSIPAEVRRRAREVRSLLSQPAGAPDGSSLRMVTASQSTDRKNQAAPGRAETAFNNTQDDAVDTQSVATEVTTVRPQDTQRIAARQAAEEARRLEEQRLAQIAAEEASRLEEERRTTEKAKLERERQQREAQRIAELQAAEEARRLEEQRLAQIATEEVSRLEEERRTTEKTKLEKERQQQEAQRIAALKANEEARRLEEQRLAQIATEEASRLEEERRATEKAKLEKKRQQQEAQRIAELQAAEEARRLEEQRLAQAAASAEADRLEAERRILEKQLRAEQIQAEETVDTQEIVTDREPFENDSQTIPAELSDSVPEIREDNEQTVSADESEAGDVGETILSEIEEAAITSVKPREPVVVLQSKSSPEVKSLSVPAPQREAVAGNNPDEEQLRNLYARVASAIVSIRTDNDDQAAGFMLNRQGNILTSWHVIEGVSDIDIEFMAISGAPRSYKARVIKHNKFRDLALLELVDPPTGIQPIQMAELALPDAGTKVRVFGQKDGQIWATDDAVITRVAKNFTWFSAGNVIHRGEILQVDLPEDGKNIGSLVTDMDYRMLGIKSFSGKKTGRTYAVSTHTINDFLNSE